MPLDPMIGSSMASGGSQFLGSIVDGIFNSIQAKKQREYNSEQSELAYQRDVDFWNMQNAYNSPKEQMARFQEAGLNPHLIYGQGTPGNAQTMVKKEVPDMPVAKWSPKLPDIIGTFFDLRQKKGITDGIQAQNKILEREADIKFIEYLDKVNKFGYDWYDPNELSLDIIKDGITGKQHNISPQWSKGNMWSQREFRDVMTLKNEQAFNTEKFRTQMQEAIAELTEHRLNMIKTEGYDPLKVSMSDAQLNEMLENMPAGMSMAKLLIMLINAAK